MPYSALTLLGSLLWCFGFAGVGWALGRSWESVDHDFRYAELAVVGAGILLLAAAIGRRLTRHRHQP